MASWCFSAGWSASKRRVVFADARRWLIGGILSLGLLAACSGGDTDDDPTSTSVERSSDASTTPNGSTVPQGEAIDTDPAVRIGELDNGLTYYVRRNDSPGSQLQLRLVVRAGSVNEEVPRSGIAHFAEHMMFNGTEEFPKNTLNDVLRGFGSEFGADLNAYTSHDETVYQLSLATVDDEAVEAAFDVLDQWAEAALISEQDTVDERGVIREEFRLRAESVDGVIAIAFDGLYTGDSDYADREPIGSEEAILATTAEQVRAFYDRWYRPDLMAVIAVGDVNPDRLEREIRDRFADNTDRGDGLAWQRPAADPLTDAHVEVLTHPDGPEPFVSLDYSLPLRASGTVEGERLLLMDEVVAAMIQDHLDEGAARGTLPIVRPFAGNFDYTRGRRFLGFNFVADDEAAGLSAVVAELLALESEGFSADQAGRAVDGFRAAVDQMLETVESRQDRDYADEYVEHYLSGFAIDSVDDAHARLTAALDSIDADEISAHYRDLMGRNAPLVVVVGADPAELPTEDELRSALDAAAEREVTLQRDAAAQALPARPDAVTETERVTVDRLNAIALEFPNGATVVIKTSDIAAGQVDLLAESNGGWSTLGPGDGPFARLAAQAVSLSGVGELDSVDLDRALTGTVVSISPYIEQTTEGFFGNAASEDVEVLFQLLHLMVTEPRVDPGPFAEVIEGAEDQLRGAQTNPGFASLVELLDARYRSDPFQQLLPDEERLADFGAEAALELYGARLGDVDDLVVAVAGDFSISDIETLARHYIGSLPEGDPDTWIDRAPDPPLGLVERAVDAGTNDSGAGFDMLLTTELGLTEDQRVAIPVLQSILNDVLVDEVREALGASYTGGQVIVDAETEPDVVVSVLISVAGDPARIDEMHSLVLGVLDDIAAGGVSAQQFEEAYGIVLADLDFINNFDLMNELLDWAEDGDDATNLASDYRRTQALRRNDISDLAARILDIDRRIEVFRRP